METISGKGIAVERVSEGAGHAYRGHRLEEPRATSVGCLRFPASGAAPDSAPPSLSQLDPED